MTLQKQTGLDARVTGLYMTEVIFGIPSFTSYVYTSTKDNEQIIKELKWLTNLSTYRLA